MVVTKLIEKLKRIKYLTKPILVSINDDLNKKFYVSTFGNSQGLPSLSTSESEPLQGNKQSNTLLRELERWKKSSVHYNPSSDVYLTRIYEYEDESYDFRYFKLDTVNDKGDSLVLISESEECIELREHYDAFDDSMLAED